jgi:membrane protease subunit (stomatin/prohibitin family)
MTIVEVVKYNGGPDIFAWKFPFEDLGTWTQLIVNESQEAILLKGGKPCDVFGSGRHTLETANIPILNNIINLPFGGKSPFAAEVWFINKVHSLDVKWGTPTPIQIQDPKYNVFIPVRSFGQFGIRIADSKKFLIKLVGTLSVFDKNNIMQYFRGLYLTKVKDVISSYLLNEKISVLQINAYLEELSDFLQAKITPTLDEYGIELVNFYVNDISVPEDDTSVKVLKDALAKRAEMEIIGYNYTQERSFDTLEGAATNAGGGAGDLMGAGIGMGMGLGVGGAFGGVMGGISQNISIKGPGTPCPQCGNILQEGDRFCNKCGYDISLQQNNKANQATCNKCGSPLSQSAKFCPQCGKKYNPCPKCGADLQEEGATCPSCGYEAPSPCPNCQQPIENKNAKFCPACGTSLVKQCSKCHTEVTGQTKFCPECGQPL